MVVSVLVAVLVWWYFAANVSPPVAAGYGFYVGAVCALGVLACSVWALVCALSSGRADETPDSAQVRR